MPVQQYSGQGFRRSPDPLVSNTNSARGTYPWSAFQATIGEIDDGDFVAETIAASGTGYSLLLFTSDTPAICNVLASDTTTGLQYSSPVANLLSTPLCVVTAGGTTAATTANYGGSVSGFGGVGSLVPVAGFPAEVDVVIGGVSEGRTAELAEVVCIANSGVINGVVGVGSSAFASADAPAPIILASSQYTLAMRTSDNLVTIGGNLFQVVGLWAVQA
jgi:hypothetical protein